ncbi:hypothetical protein [Allomuricauda sp. d1]|uniref:hypothetical protein n=1 Tax=Allomuricauda sp. d1 TaxID=3136725 RepID=UPI0031DAB4DA
MKRDEMIGMIVDYFDGALTDAQKRAFEAHLKSSATFAKEVEEHRILLQAFEKEERQLPSKNLEAGFLAMLEEEKNNQAKMVSIAPEQKNWMFALMKIAAGIAILIAIFYLGRYSKQQESQERIQMAQKESLEAKQMTVLAMMENQSANKRIQGVQFIEEIDEPDQDIVAALAERLRNDENTNVRMAALDALARFSSSELVKTVFLETLEVEKNPSVQIALIQNLVKMGEKKAVAPMKKLLEQEDTQPFIKDEINQALPKII